MASISRLTVVTSLLSQPPKSDAKSSEEAMLTLKLAMAMDEHTKMDKKDFFTQRTNGRPSGPGRPTTYNDICRILSMPHSTINFAESKTEDERLAPVAGSTTADTTSSPTSAKLVVSTSPSGIRRSEAEANVTENLESIKKSDHSSMLEALWLQRQTYNKYKDEVAAKQARLAALQDDLTYLVKEDDVTEQRSKKISAIEEKERECNELETALQLKVDYNATLKHMGDRLKHQQLQYDNSLRALEEALRLKRLDAESSRQDAIESQQEKETELHALKNMEDAAEKHRSKWADKLLAQETLLEHREKLMEWAEQKVKAKENLAAKKAGDLSKEEEEKLRASTAVARMKAFTSRNASIGAYFSVDELRTGITNIKAITGAKDGNEILDKWEQTQLDLSHMEMSNKALEEANEQLKEKRASLLAFLSELKYSAFAMPEDPEGDITRGALGAPEEFEDAEEELPEESGRVSDEEFTPLPEIEKREAGILKAARDEHQAITKTMFLVKQCVLMLEKRLKAASAGHLIKKSRLPLPSSAAGLKMNQEHISPEFKEKLISIDQKLSLFLESPEAKVQPLNTRVESFRSPTINGPAGPAGIRDRSSSNGMGALSSSSSHSLISGSSPRQFASPDEDEEAEQIMAQALLKNQFNIRVKSAKRSSSPLLTEEEDDVMGPSGIAVPPSLTSIDPTAIGTLANKFPGPPNSLLAIRRGSRAFLTPISDDVDDDLIISKTSKLARVR